MAKTGARKRKSARVPVSKKPPFVPNPFESIQEVVLMVATLSIKLCEGRGVFDVLDGPQTAEADSRSLSNSDLIQKPWHWPRQTPNFVPESGSV